MKKFKNITTCPTENDVFLFINMATTSVPSKHAPNFITNPTPIPRSNPRILLPKEHHSLAQVQV